MRIARFEGSIYLDLADEQWQVVEITQHGWSIVTNSPVKFCRPGGLRALPAPIHGGDVLKLRAFVNCRSDDQFVMIVAWLLGTLMAAGPYPILEVGGEQGCAKSTTRRVLRQLIDPNKADLRSLPRNERHLAIAARNSHILGFDNLSRCDSDQSDALCRIATGSGFSSRELFTNFDECLFSGARPIVMNGIGGVASRPDLLDRTIRITLPAMDPARRIDERKLWASFYEARPSILGALLDAVSTGLCRLDQTELDEAPRMADFALWVKACEPALPWNDGDFLRSYAGNRRKGDMDAIDASVIGPAILTFIQTSGLWKGTATDLLRALAPQFENRPQAGWPTDGTRMSKELRRIAPPLRACGYEVEFGNDSDRRIRLGRLPVRDDADQRG